MLLDGAISKIIHARGCLDRNDMAAKGRSITGAVAIVGELRDSLDHKVDRALSQRLDSLYEYVSRRLLFAQLNNDPAALDESARLLTPIRDGWKGMRESYLSSRSKAVAAVAS
jgi:flagellar protein FliS